MALASEHLPLLERLHKGANCVVFLDGEPEPAADVADMLRKAAAKIESDAKAIAERDTRIAQLQEANHCIPEFEAKVAADAKVIAALREALDLTQFGFNHRRCPVCAGWEVGPNGETDKVHTAECPVALALAASEQTAGEK